MKKQTLKLQLVGKEEGATVEGYALTLDSGMEAVVHKAHPIGSGWITSFYPTGIKICQARTRQASIDLANSRLSKFSKADLDQQLIDLLEAHEERNKTVHIFGGF